MTIFNQFEYLNFSVEKNLAENSLIGLIQLFRDAQNGPVTGGQGFVSDLRHHVALLHLQRQVQPQPGHPHDVRPGKEPHQVCCLLLQSKNVEALSS